MKIFHLVSILVFSITSNVWCRNTSHLDSLIREELRYRKVSNTSMAFTQKRVNILNDIADEYLSTNADESIKYSTLAQSVASSAKYLKGEARAIRLQGIAYEYKGELSKAQLRYRAALRIFSSLKDTASMAESLNDIGIIYEEFADYPEALKFYFSGVRLLGDKKYQKTLGHIFPNIGNVYSNLDSIDLAIKYYLQTIEIMKKAGLESVLDGVYCDLAGCYMKLHQKDLAIEYYKKSIDIRVAAHNQYGLANTYLNVSYFYSQEESFVEAEKYALLSLQMAKEVGDIIGQSWALHCLGDIFYKTGNINKAASKEKEALLLVRQTGSKKLEQAI